MQITEGQIDFTKSVIQLVVASAASSTASALIKSNLPEALTLTKRVQYVLGTGAIAGVVSAHTMKWSGKEFDAVRKMLRIKPTEDQSEETPKE